MIDLESIKEELERTLPIIVSREKVAEFTGGIYCAQTMRNFDSLGIGPDEILRVGNRKVAYTKNSFIKWFMEKLSEAK